MTYDIIVRFPDKESADIYTHELAERGPNYFDFTPFLKEEGGPHGTAKYTETTENGNRVFYVEPAFSKWNCPY